MARSPLPNIPRLARRRRPAPSEILLACPRISPEWELAALKALIKPQAKDAILHRPAEQKLTPAILTGIRHAMAAFAERTDFQPHVHWPDEGDYHFAITVNAADETFGRALAVAISRAAPELWLSIGRVLVHDGRFFRRERGVRLDLVEASNVHLPRELRRALVTRNANLPSPERKTPAGNS